MRITKGTKSFAGTIAATVLVSTTVMSYSFTWAHSAAHSSSSSTSGLQNNQPTAERPADGSGPLAITPALDTARAATATMAEAGGTLSVTASNGTTFMLTIPPDALVSEEEITMAPVAAIPDLPLSGGLDGAGAVELGPEGLLLVAPATLVITPSISIPIEAQSPFAWYNAGEDFHLYPLTLDLNSFTFAVTHFNGFGIGMGTSSDRQAVDTHQAGRSEARLNQQIQMFSEVARGKLSKLPTSAISERAKPENGSKGKAQKAVKVFKNDIEQILIQAIHALIERINQDAAAGNEAALRCDLLNAVSTVNMIHEGYVDMQGKYQLNLEILTSDAVPFEKALEKALQTLANASNQRCQQGQVEEIATLLGLTKFAKMLAGLDATLSPLSKLATSISNEAAACASLQLRFDSTVSLTLPLSAVRIDIPVTVTPESSIGGVALTPQKDSAGNFNGIFTGNGPLLHKDITTSLLECGITGQEKTDSTLSVVSLEFNLKLRDVNCPGEDAKPITDIIAVMDVGRPSESFTVTCQPPLPPFTGSGEVWRAHFYCRHQGESVNGSGSTFQIKGWDVGKPGEVASKTYTLAAACPGFTENTVIRLEKAQ